MSHTKFLGLPNHEFARFGFAATPSSVGTGTALVGVFGGAGVRAGAILIRPPPKPKDTG